jgi:hypothetical protein
VKDWIGRVGLAVTGAAFVVMSSALVQYLVARNQRRRMDLAFSGGFVGVGLLVLGVVVLVAERAWLAVEDEPVAQRAFVASLGGVGGGGAADGPIAAVVSLPTTVVASANSYHRPDCLLVQGRAGVEPLSLDEARGSGLSACRLCLKGLA